MLVLKLLKVSNVEVKKFNTWEDFLFKKIKLHKYDWDKIKLGSCVFKLWKDSFIFKLLKVIWEDFFYKKINIIYIKLNYRNKILNTCH